MLNDSVLKFFSCLNNIGNILTSKVIEKSVRARLFFAIFE